MLLGLLGQHARDGEENAVAARAGMRCGKSRGFFMSARLRVPVCQVEIAFPTKGRGKSCVGESYCKGQPRAEVGAEPPFLLRFLNILFLW